MHSENERELIMGNMAKLSQLMALAIAGIAATFACTAHAIQIPTVNLEEECPSYHRGEYTQDQVNSLQRNGVNLPVACQPFEVRSGAERLAVNMMAQFYSVKESSVQVASTFRGKREGKVRVADENGHVCTFDLMEAPSGAEAPYGWVIANTICVLAEEKKTL